MELAFHVVVPIALQGPEGVFRRSQAFVCLDAKPLARPPVSSGPVISNAAASFRASPWKGALCDEGNRSLCPYGSTEGLANTTK
jgi:hypothetical protein